jgi:hypothetical protein
MEEFLPDYGARGLPYGLYRFHCTNRRCGADDPPEFMIDKEYTEIPINVDLPRTFRITIALYRGDGKPFERCLVQKGGVRAHISREAWDVPTWAMPRMPLGRVWVRGDSGGAAESLPEKGWSVREAAGDGRIVIDEFIENEVGVECDQFYGVRVLSEQGRGTVLLHMKYWNVESADFIAVAPTVAEVLEHVSDEGGNDVSRAPDANVRVWCDAVRRLEVARQWEGVLVHVIVSRTGYHTLEYSWSVRTRHAKHQMRRMNE